MSENGGTVPTGPRQMKDAEDQAKRKRPQDDDSTNSDHLKRGRHDDAGRANGAGRKLKDRKPGPPAKKRTEKFEKENEYAREKREHDRDRDRDRGYNESLPGRSRPKSPPKGPRRGNNARGRGTRRGGHKQDYSRDKQQPHNQGRSRSREPAERPPSPARVVMRQTPVWKRVQQVGEGTYGRVYKARNEVTGRTAALKRLRLDGDKDGMPITAIREVRLLQSLRHHSIVSLHEMMIDRGEVYMAFEYLDHDLSGLLLNNSLSLTEGNVKNLFKQMMEGLAYLHHKNILHRDIKGSNILVDRYGRVKLADFGLARKVDLKNLANHYTNRVITLWYRPPELLLGATIYNDGIDNWGMGCLLVELFVREAIFQGKDDIAQLEKVYTIMGSPTLALWPGLQEMPWYHMLLPRATYPRLFEEKYAGLIPEAALDLASKLLIYDPKKRMAAESSLSHRYFTEGPPSEQLDLGDIGEWHDFEAKARRRKGREREKERQKRESEQRSSEVHT